MTTHETTTNEPMISPCRMNARATRTAAPPACVQRTSSLRPCRAWPVSTSRTAALTLVIWLVAASATDDYQPPPGARADQTVPAVQNELTDQEVERLNNRTEADRRHLDSWRMEQQVTEQRDEREVQGFSNRAEADRRQVEKQRDEQRPTDLIDG
jgi:hypothetical protein